MQVELIKENEDGSANFSFNLTNEERDMLLTFGIRRALEEAAKLGKEWQCEVGEVDQTGEVDTNSGDSDA